MIEGDDLPEDKPLRRGPRWMLSFADLLSMILVFFVLAYAMKSINLQKWRELTRAFGGEGSVVAQAEPEPAGRIDRAAGINLDYLATVLQRVLAADPALPPLRPELRDGRAVIRLPAELMAALTAQGDAAERLAASLAGVLDNLPNAIGLQAYVGQPGEAAGWSAPLDPAARLAAALRRGGGRKTLQLVASGRLDGRRPGDLDLVILPGAER